MINLELRPVEMYNFLANRKLLNKQEEKYMGDATLHEFMHNFEEVSKAVF